VSRVDYGTAGVFVNAFAFSCLRFEAFKAADVPAFAKDAHLVNLQSLLSAFAASKVSVILLKASDLFDIP
jgi:hypothetical protein